MAIPEVKLHEELMEELVQSPGKLRPPPPGAQHDKSAPFIPSDVHVSPFPKKELLSQIEHGVPLHHLEADQRHDTSAPYIEDGLSLQLNRHAELMEQVRTVGTHKMAMKELKQTFLEEAREGGLPLKHVVPHDTSGPHIPPSAGITQDGASRAALLQEVLQHPPLTHVDPSQTHDTSAPHLQPPPPGMPILQPGGDPHKALMEELTHEGTSHLHHVDPQLVVDKSAPLVTKSVALQFTADQRT